MHSRAGWSDMKSLKIECYDLDKWSSGNVDIEYESNDEDYYPLPFKVIIGKEKWTSLEKFEPVLEMIFNYAASVLLRLPCLLYASSSKF